jgi:hypothetical protein
VSGGDVSGEDVSGEDVSGEDVSEGQDLSEGEVDMLSDGTADFDSTIDDVIDGEPDRGDLSDLTPDAEREPVTVRIWNDGVAWPAQTVVFSDSAGEIIETTMTGDDGSVTRYVEPDAMVTAAVTIGDMTILRTVMGVQPGDEIPFGVPTAPADTEAVGRLAVTLPGAVTDATDYIVTIGCENSESSELAEIFVEVTADCLHGEDRVDLLVFARDVDGEPLEIATVTEVEVATEGDTRVVLETWDDTVSSLHVVMTNLPAGSHDLDLDGLLNGQQFELMWAGDGGEVTGGGTVDYTTVVPDGFFTQLHYYWQSFLDDSETERATVIAERIEWPDSLERDLGVVLLATPGVAEFDGDRTFSWIEPSETSEADAAFLQTRWVGSDPEGMWVVWFPPETGSPLVLPRMPDSLTGYRPPSEMGAFGTAVGYFDMSNTADYAEFRTTYGPDLLSIGAPSEGEYVARFSEWGLGG